MNASRPAHRVLWHPAARDDLVRLDGIEPAIADAALAAVFDVAHHHKHGKALGIRPRSGDLTGYYRVKFDVRGARPERFHLVYERPDADTILVWALSERADQSVYRDSAARADPKP